MFTKKLLLQLLIILFFTGLVSGCIQGTDHSGTNVTSVTSYPVTTFNTSSNETIPDYLQNSEYSLDVAKKAISIALNDSEIMPYRNLSDFRICRVYRSALTVYLGGREGIINLPTINFETNNLTLQAFVYLSSEKVASVRKNFSVPSPAVSSTNASPVCREPSPSPTPFQPDGKMTVYFIDVGEGDSELIESPSGMIMLIDGGPPDAVAKIEHYLRIWGISSIDILVISNPNDDHIGGLSAIIKDYPIKQVIDGGFTNSSDAYIQLITSIRQKNIPVMNVEDGDTISFDRDVPVQVLNPTVNRSADTNQNSVVLKMTFKNNTFLFASDAGGEAEMRYARTAGHVNILKVADHGSGNSSSEEFLSIVRPGHSIIEVGAGNPYGYPAKATLDRILHTTTRGAFRTDRSGTINVISTGNSIYIDNEKVGIYRPISR